MNILKKHPRGLPFLFFTEMWERFGYYLMFGIFFLYMTDTEKGGLSMTNAEAADIFGTFIALVYLTPFVGGLLADKIMGYKNAVTLGGILMGLGYMGLSMKGMGWFYASLSLIIVGNGFFKPNISTLLGYLYNTPQYKEFKDTGYNIFYMGINIGAFICNFFAAYLRNTLGWGAAFMGAGIGMILGLIIFWSGNKNYSFAIQPKKDNEMPVGKVLGIVLVPAFISGFLGWIIPGNIFGSDSTDAFLLGALPVVGYYINLLVKSEKHERQQISAMLAIFGVAIVFWAVFKQNGTALTTWAEKYTNREVPAAIQKPLETFSLSQKMTFNKDSVTLTDHHFRPIKNESGDIQKVIDYPGYFKNIANKSELKDGDQLNLISTELFQSINPFFVIILTPLVVLLFSFLRRRKKEPDTPAKIGWGLFITGLSTIVMIAAVWSGQNGIEKSSALWLVGSYAVITFGELFISPMGLSLVSKLSPPRITAVMMGGWFLSTSLGNKLSGVLASMWDKYEDKSMYFTVNFIACMLAAIALWMLHKWLSKITKEHGA